MQSVQKPYNYVALGQRNQVCRPACIVMHAPVLSSSTWRLFPPRFSRPSTEQRFVSSPSLSLSSHPPPIVEIQFLLSIVHRIRHSAFVGRVCPQVLADFDDSKSSSSLSSTSALRTSSGGSISRRNGDHGTPIESLLSVASRQTRVFRFVGSRGVADRL